ncbi:MULTISPECIES: hypothetical protein [Streptomyces]|uniref:Gram-positive cocci surface proteins LPxTG domain-containing protein n=1 Tax=Streptomyces pseudovenezuelae TaxID=67350 RepID=A0A101N4A6_9ACTN|nr:MULTISPECIES: hypothetical protein [Streptomyces]KUM86282.1 hypothetical protein AQI94_22225 [Streptomyces pseudovenezuelae]
MRSARILLTTAAASAVLVLGAPGAFAAGDDWDSSDSSYSKEHTNPKYDPETYKDKDSEQGRESGGGKHDGGGWSGSHEKPSGGMHTGGGGLASPAVTTGGLAMLGVAGAGLYAARRKRTVGSMA